mmetsp:Transcript_19632/g.68309  ORF Transcript_19632/g.68309 Transcript_19632/m.68309 type:complete len:343 (+) Transcript_19632:1492-2520(+)
MSLCSKIGFTSMANSSSLSTFVSPLAQSIVKHVSKVTNLAKLVQGGAVECITANCASACESASCEPVLPKNSFRALSRFSTNIFVRFTWTSQSFAPSNADSESSMCFCTSTFNELNSVVAAPMNSSALISNTNLFFCGVELFPAFPALGTMPPPLPAELSAAPAPSPAAPVAGVSVSLEMSKLSPTLNFNCLTADSKESTSSSSSNFIMAFKAKEASLIFFPSTLPNKLAFISFNISTLGFFMSRPASNFSPTTTLVLVFVKLSVSNSMRVAPLKPLWSWRKASGRAFLCSHSSMASLGLSPASSCNHLQKPAIIFIEIRLALSISRVLMVNLAILAHGNLP